MKRRGQPLPEVPTGHEWLDLVWSQMVPAADTYVAILPTDADPRWATELGLQLLSISLLETRAAKNDVQRTPRHTTLCRVRARRLRRLGKQFEGQALAVLGAIADQVRAWHPEASAAQLLMATRDTFRNVSRKAAVGGVDSDACEGARALRCGDHQGAPP
jgi:hypothetical protein